MRRMRRVLRRERRDEELQRLADRIKAERIANGEDPEAPVVVTMEQVRSEGDDYYDAAEKYGEGYDGPREKVSWPVFIAFLAAIALLCLSGVFRKLSLMFFGLGGLFPHFAFADRVKRGVRSKPSVAGKTAFFLASAASIALGVYLLTKKM